MATTTITPDLIRKYLKEGKRRKGYDQTVKAYVEMKVHIDGEYPSTIIDRARPSEPDHIKEFRKEIFAHITMPYTSKVVTSLSKIRKSEDWDIKYDPSAVPSTIIKGETLQDYMDFNFPHFASATNWLFQSLLRQYLMDAHAVVAVFPISKATPSNEYHKPFPYIFHADQVIEFVENDFCILKSTDKVQFTAVNQQTSYEYKAEGDVYYIITTQSVERWEASSTDLGFTRAWQQNHNFGELPAFEVKGLSWTVMDTVNLYRPRIYPMLPFLNEAVREYSDLQAGVIQHVFLERWEYQNEPCKVCSGTGKVKKGDRSVKCPASGCSGGNIIRSPYNTLYVRQPLPGELPPPNPPAGYIDRNPEIIKVQDQRVDNHNYKALSAINMEFLAQTPLSISGDAKITDREETNTFAYGIAEDLVAIMDKVYYFSNNWRYIKIVPDRQARIKMLPKINVPEKFDLFTTAVLVEELKKFKEAKVNPALIKALEIECASKKFGHDVEVKTEVSLVLNLDPLPGLSTDEKSTMVFNKGISEQDYIISCNISSFIKRALMENPKFPELAFQEQKKVIARFADEVKKATDEAEKLKEAAMARQQSILQGGTPADDE